MSKNHKHSDSSFSQGLLLEELESKVETINSASANTCWQCRGSAREGRNLRVETIKSDASQGLGAGMKEGRPRNKNMYLFYGFPNLIGLNSLVSYL